MQSKIFLKENLTLQLLQRRHGSTITKTSDSARSSGTMEEATTALETSTTSQRCPSVKKSVVSFKVADGVAKEILYFYYFV